MNEKATPRDNPPFVQITLGVLTTLGVLGAAYIAGGWQFGNWGNTNRAANSTVDNHNIPPGNVNTTHSPAVPEAIAILTPKNDGVVEARRQRDGSAVFAVETSISDNLRTDHPNAVVLILIKHGDEWWAQDYKRGESGKTHFEGWSGGPGNAAKENEPLKIRAIVIDATKAPGPGTLVKGGENAAELEPIALSKVVDFKISKIR